MILYGPLPDAPAPEISRPVPPAVRTVIAPVLSHPFRLDSGGRIVTVAQDSDECKAERIVVLMLTRPGERPLAPAFGIPDPTYVGGLSQGLVEAAVATFGPDVRIVDLRSEPGRAGEQHVTIEFI